MNTLGKPIKEVIKIHYGMVLQRVVTFPLITDAKIKDYFAPNSLNYAALEKVEVLTVGPNESRTGLVISGNLIKKDGQPLYDDPKKNFVEKIDIPFDQSNVAIQPGVWFDEEKTAQLYAKDINSKSKSAVERIALNLEKFTTELNDFIKIGV